ncbi:hypothetical protein DEO72_LG9g1194 [Vigna unguiculata]|uniref:DUF4378 domain-containing protein n=1 Tax=Vigna unguiculata TaxID=3917 RepID=A0A4D6MXL9_VIGUN|nr:hypothetical protein DEO72_LG9g1194 [Vigna unguiculata]
MGRRIREKECALPSRNSSSSHHTHPGRVWGILHVIKYHHWRQVKRRLTTRRHGGGRPDERVERPGTSDDSGLNSMPDHCIPYTELSNVEEKLEQSPSPSKSSIKSRFRSLINEDIYRRKSRHKRSSTCPAKTLQLPHADSVHNLEVDPLSELLLTVENPEPVLRTFQNHLAAGTLDALSPVFSDKRIANCDKCVDCGTMFCSDTLEQSKIHNHKHLSSPIQDGPEEKSFNAQILTTDASPHLFKDFLDALDVINANKNFLLEYIQDPGSPLPFHTHHQQSLKANVRRARSLSFPVSASSSGKQDSDPGQLIDQMIDDLLIAEKKNLQTQRSMPNESTRYRLEDSHKQFIPCGSSHNFEQVGERDLKSTPVSSRVPHNVRTSHFRDLRKKMKRLIEEGRNEKRRITMDAILDKIPRGKRLTKNMKKLIHDKSKDPTVNGEGEESSTSGFENRLSSMSFNKRQRPPMRNSSLKESIGRYSQLYDTCFNSEAKYPRVESSRVKEEEKNSTLKTPKSFKRFLSMPNLKSYFHHNDESSFLLSPKNSMKVHGDRNISANDIEHDHKRFNHSEDSKSQIFPPTLVNNTNQEISLNADQKQLLVRSASKSGINFSAEEKETNMGIECLENLRDRGQDIGAEVDTYPAEANSAFSSDTSFLDVSFDLENIDIPEGYTEEVNSEIKQGQDDGSDHMSEQQEAEENHPEEGENFQNIGTLNQSLNYEFPCIEIDPSNVAAFNYVTKVLDLSGFTDQDSLGIWYSDNQPVGPAVYEELEGCLLLDPHCSGNSGEGGECNHMLLFDIVNEGLLKIFGRSYNYYPRPLSTLSHVHPLPTGDNVLYDVWKLISWYLNSTISDSYISLDYYVSKDLSKYDGWMNLQFDSECVGLEIDDLIFDDLLEEIIFTQLT